MALTIERTLNDTNTEIWAQKSSAVVCGFTSYFWIEIKSFLVADSYDPMHIDTCEEY